LIWSILIVFSFGHLKVHVHVLESNITILLNFGGTCTSTTWHTGCLAVFLGKTSYWTVRSIFLFNLSWLFHCHICGWNLSVWPSKWKLLSSTFMWYCFFMLYKVVQSFKSGWNPSVWQFKCKLFFCELCTLPLFLSRFFVPLHMIKSERKQTPW